MRLLAAVTVEEFEDVLLRAAKVGMKMPAFIRSTMGLRP
jgi:hypothetical protein